ncbi:MAG: AbrB/MazE/SpoVT family DNA-binding domain-containing protein [Pyrinomonadaceae bacterium]
MSRRKITAAGDSAALLLPQEVLDQMGVGIGDEIDMTVVDRTLILRPPDEAERARKIDAAADAVFARRQGAYEELAKGAE